MPRVSIDTLPDSSRLWVFAASDPVRGGPAHDLLLEVDEYLDRWKAHGVPLVVARDWHEDRFLAVAVDEEATGASGCSIDALFRILRDVQAKTGTTLVGAGRVFYRDPSGEVRCTDRSEFIALRRAGVVADDTPVFDTAVTSLGDYRRTFERPLATSWHGQLV